MIQIISSWLSKGLPRWSTRKGGIAQLLASNTRSSLHLQPTHSIISKRPIVSGTNALKQSVEMTKVVFWTIRHYAKRRYFPSKIRKCQNIQELSRKGTHLVPWSHLAYKQRPPLLPWYSSMSMVEKRWQCQIGVSKSEG